MSEELKGQLAERAPGVISAMAEAAGFGTDSDAAAKLFKAMEDGDVKAKDVLEKFSAILLERAKQGGALEKAMKSTAAEQQRFNTAFDKTVVAFSEGGFDKAIAKFFREMTENMNKGSGAARGLGEAFAILMKPVYAVIRLFGDLGKASAGLAETFGVSQGKLIAFGVAAVANLTPLGRIVTVISAAALALEDFATYLEGGQSKFGEWFAGLSEERQERLKEFGNKVTKIVEDLGKLYQLLSNNPEETWFSKFVDDVTSSSLMNALDKVLEQFKLIALIGGQLANGDFSGAGITLASSTMRGVAKLPDALLPGAPMTGFLDKVGIPSTSSTIANIEQKYAEQQALAGKSMLPIANQQTIQRVEINVNGAQSPVETAGLVKKALDDLMQKTKTNLVEVRK